MSASCGVASTTQIFRSGAAEARSLATQVADQIGGSARGYQRLPAPLAISVTVTQTVAKSYFYALPALA